MKAKRQYKKLPSWEIPKLTFLERCFNFFHIMNSLNFINPFVWFLFATYEFILWTAMPIMGA